VARRWRGNQTPQLPFNKEKANMRSTKLTAAGLTLAASLMLCCAATAAALRLPHAHRYVGPAAGGCRVTFYIPTVVSAGESAVAFGYLKCRGQSADEQQPVTVYQRSAGSTSFSVAATGTTETAGAYKVEVKDLTTDSVVYVTAGSAQSRLRMVKVLAELTLAGPPEGVLLTRLHGLANQQTFTGTVSPEDKGAIDKGAIVVLQRQNSTHGEEWHRIGISTVGENGAFTIKHTFVVPGPANIRVVMRDPGVNEPSPSNILAYEIEQAQNPLLVINSSADPISYGQSATISGTIAGVPANTPLQLLERPAEHVGFTQVAEAKSDGSGNYVFPSQTPPVGTVYKVQGAGKTSAPMYVGVKYLLTASISPGTTLQVGQPFTFTGTVKPGIAGHVVYLEREDASHIGFHPVEVGEVVAPTATQPEYTYSITRAFYSVGTTRVRVRIPGDPINGGTASEPITIQLTQAPASSLTPQMPGRLPSEGQI
jgi:hypothetical protein